MLLFMDGFDKYGGANSVNANVAALLTQEWTNAVQATALNIVSGLSGSGYALFLQGSSAPAQAGVSKTLPGSYSRLIGGMRFSTNLTTGPFQGGVLFLDGASAQCCIVFNSNGTIAIKNGTTNSSTILATSTVSITAGSVHYLEWDVTFNNSGVFTVWLDGIAIIGGSSGVTGTGDTTATANPSATGVVFQSPGINSATVTVDDIYICDSTGSAPLNAALLTSPRIETQFPTSDGAVQFAVGAGILGSSTQRDASGASTAANHFRVRAHIPVVNCTLNSITFMPNATSATIQLRPIIYTDSSISPGTLMSAGPTVVGMTANTPVTMPLTTPQSLTAGTRYWLGLMCDIAVTSGFKGYEGNNIDRTATSTFASGAPGTAPATAAALSVLFWGNTTPASGNNWSVVSNNPPQGSYSYLYDATVGHEDLYNMPVLSVTPSTIYSASVKANVAKSDAGAKTISIRQKSGATDSAGAGGTQAPAISFAWVTSLFERDPNGSIAWTKAALDAAQIGIKIES